MDWHFNSVQVPKSFNQEKNSALLNAGMNRRSLALTCQFATLVAEGVCKTPLPENHTHNQQRQNSFWHHPDGAKTFGITKLS
jgi:hypothetical protein